MKKIKILILNRNEFINYINKHQYNPNIAYISVNDTIGPYSQSPLENKDYKNSLILHFDDVIQDGQPSPTVNSTNTRSFSVEQAHKIIDFVNKNKYRHFIIHCVAGISRSGAIGTFISNYINNVDYNFFKKYNTRIAPNMYILTTLINNSQEKS